MLILVLSSNLVGMLLGWEGVGLCAYLLIGYWYDDQNNAKAGMKAFITNRVGDLGFILALLLIITFAKTVEISEIITFFNSPEAASLPSWFWVAFCLGLFWASTGKSAQIPLYVWLPDAMAGPTPVSALIHAATMVTSGIFICVRLWPIFASQEAVLHLIFWVGTATAWLAALIALTQRDIKKVLAYSTISQLGFMFAAIGAGAPVAAFFHLVTHACFKALLFLGAGSVITGMHHKNDIALMGGLRSKMPWTHLTFLIGTLAIIGFPFTAGFFSKDMILIHALDLAGGTVGFVFLLGAALLTAFYMLRVYTLTFWGPARSSEAESARESSWIMVAPLAVLALLSVVVGWTQTPHLFGGFHVVQSWIQASWYGVDLPGASTVHHSVATELIFLAVITGGSLLVALFAYKKYKDKDKVLVHEGFAYRLSQKKFYVDELYEAMFIRPLQYATKVSAKVLDNLCIDGFLHTVTRGTFGSGTGLSLLHNGNVQTYAWFLFVGVIVFIFLFWWVI